MAAFAVSDVYTGEHADHNGGLTILSESELRGVSKSLSTLLPISKKPAHEDEAKDGSIRSLQKLLERLLFTADSTILTISHGAGALGALSGFLDRCSIVSDGSVRAIVLNEEILRRILRIYLFRAENHKPKPLRRLLITLGLLINRLPTKEHRSHVVGEAVELCVQAVCESELIVAIKSAIQLLEHLLSKQIVDAALLLDRALPLLAGSGRERSNIDDGDIVQSFAVKVLEWVQYPDCAPAISHFLLIYFNSVKASRKIDSQDKIRQTVKAPSLWIGSVRRFMRIQPESFSSLEEHILPTLLAHNEEELGDFIHSMSPFTKNDLPCESDDMTDVLLCLLACRTASRMGHAKLKTLSPSKANSPADVIDPMSLSLSLLDHASPSIRINAITTLVSLVKPAEAFEDTIVVRLKECIPYFLLETSSKSRNEFIAVMKKFSNTIRMAVPALAGKATEYEPSNAAEFLQWYMCVLVQELRPTAPYQTHITALNLILGFIQSFGRDTHVNKILRLTTPNYERYRRLFRQLSRVLLDLLFNAFDDVRQIAAEILGHFVESEFQMRSKTVSVGSKARDREDATLTIIDQILDCVTRARDLFHQTSRADHADGLGRILNLAFSSRQYSSNLYDQMTMYHDLVYDLQKDLDEEAEDLNHAVGTRPLHGHLIALRYIIARPQTSLPHGQNASLSTFTFARDLLPLWHQVWTTVRPILCIDAPEGQVFPASSSSDTAYGDQAKLSSCWRALKESSLLMSATISNIQSNAHYLHEVGSIRDDYHSIGALAFEQLAELRHRGAFSTVSQTFAAWCVTCRRLPGFESLLFPFYQKILACIYQKADALTRRSAGLPAMVTGLLSAFPNGHFFDEVLLDLQAIADTPFEGTDANDLLQLPQVHALNCLKDIFTDARFAFSSEPHISDCLGLAAQCLHNPVWAVRNCGLMLMKALLNRINGGTDISSTRVSSSHRRFSKSVYEKYPHLPQLTLGLLSPTSSHAADIRGGSGSRSLHAQKVFPGLEIVERFGFQVSLREPIERAILRHLEGPVWPIREKAARALSTGAASKDVVEEVRRLLSSGWNSQNALHGRLLYLRSLLLQNKSALHAHSTTDALFLLFDQYLETHVVSNECPITAASFLDLVADLFECVQQRISEAPIPNGSTQPRSILGKSGEKFVTRCGPFFDQLLEANNTVPVLASQALLVQSLNRLQALLNYARQDIVQANPAAPLELLLPNLPINPLSGEEDLCRQGEVLGARFAQDPENSRVLNIMTMWTRSLVLACTDTLFETGTRKAAQDPETRITAVSSIKRFTKSFSDAGGRLQDTLEFLHIWLLLCDLLVDDDDEVRKQAAELTCRMLHRSSQQEGGTKKPSIVSPPATKGRLLNYLVGSYNQSDCFWAETIVRMTGQLSKVDIRGRVAAPATRERIDFVWYRNGIRGFQYSLYLDRLRTFRSGRSQPIFEEENPNLYLDPVREADMWTKAATSLLLPLCDESRSRDQTGKTWDVALWMFLRAMNEFKKITEVDAETGKDNSLGYASGPEAFGVIFAIVCLLKLTSQGIKDKVINQKLPGLVGENAVRAILRLDAPKVGTWLQNYRLSAREARLHELLLSKLDDLLEELDSLTPGEVLDESGSDQPNSSE